MAMCGNFSWEFNDENDEVTYLIAEVSRPGGRLKCFCHPLDRKKSLQICSCPGGFTYGQPD